MTILKKSPFLVLLLGFVSLSICNDEKREEEEEHDEETEDKRELSEDRGEQLRLYGQLYPCKFPRLGGPKCLAVS
ncbi:hypothetical protein GDO81_027468 [Engystomops pustulosus]|uniref:Frog antimicrobial peptide propeptide domain-containing protein n=1 Tax=Engystomops pustulosus TaxID=76066 RepID=A0AAV6ZE61_ENGPU|nr:hypothetical protein GDO81_027468 [Engystomops pustulosus]